MLSSQLFFLSTLTTLVIIQAKLKKVDFKFDFWLNLDPVRGSIIQNEALFRGATFFYFGAILAVACYCIAYTKMTIVVENTQKINYECRTPASIKINY